MIRSISNKTDAAGQTAPTFKRPQEIVAGALQRQVANAFNLYLNYKHYHWQTFGPLFRDLNIIFDEFANEVYKTVEELSQRVRMIGQNRLRVREFSKNASVKPARENKDIRRMVQEADSNALLVIREMREAIRKAEPVDPVSAGLLKRLLKIHEKHQWWLHYILDKRQGFTA